MSAAKFLCELDAQKSLEALQNAKSQKSVLIFKSVSLNQVIRTCIENLADKKVMLKLDTIAVRLDENEIFSLKFNVGTEIFFAKTKLKTFLNQYYFDLTTPVVEYKRRKHIRYIIPKKWNQSLVIMGYQKNGHSGSCRILDLSLAGLRIEVSDPATKIKINDFLEIQFKIHQRAAIKCHAQVCFLMATKINSFVLGLEFLTLTQAQRDKVTSLTEDIKNFIALDKS